MRPLQLPRACARPAAPFAAVPVLSRTTSSFYRRPATATWRRAAVPPRKGDDGDDDRVFDNGDEYDDERGDGDGETPHPRRNRPSSRDTARALEALRGPAHKKIGAEYGEGFVQLRPSGEAERLDVDALNERLSPSGALRLRRSLLAPDEAHAALFSFEGVIADTRSAQAAAWAAVAEERGLPWPPPEAPSGPASPSSSGGSSGRTSPVLPPSVLVPPRVALVCSLRPERAVTEVLRWTSDWGLASRIAADVAHRYVSIVRGGASSVGGASSARWGDDPRPYFCSPRPGVAKWLSALRSARVPAAVVTSLDRQTLLSALECMGLDGGGAAGGSPGSSPFSSIVTAEDGAESLAHSLLAAALKLARPPNACCAFVSSPAGVAAAHNASMRAVAVLQGDHAAHELRSADATVSRLDELRVIQVRRLFAAGGPAGGGDDVADVGGMPRQKERTGGDDGGDERGWRGRWSRPRGVAGGLMDPEDDGEGGGRRR